MASPSAKWFLALFASIVVLGEVQSVVVTLGTTTPTVNEGDLMRITCTGDSVAVRDIHVALTVAAGTTAEDGYDAPPIGGCDCIIYDGRTTGSVAIRTFTDHVMDSDVYMIHGTVANPHSVNAAVVSITINDVVSASGTMVNIALEKTDYAVSEAAGALGVVVKFTDDLGNPAPIEANYQLGVAFTDDSATGGTTGAAPDDYSNALPATANLMAGTNGNGVLSATVMIAVVEDTVIENGEQFTFTLTAAAAPAVPMKLDTTTKYTVTIQDNDKPEINVVNNFVALPRKSKKGVYHYVFTEGANGGIADPVMGPNQAAFAANTTTLPAGTMGRRFRFPEPKTETWRRFTEFSYSTTQIVGAATVNLRAITHVSATNRLDKRQAPINSCVGSTITIYPLDTTSGNDNLGEDAVISVAWALNSTKITSQLRWNYISSAMTDMRLTTNNGRDSLNITKRSQAGLYVISRLKRRVRGWQQFVRVILSECPKGMYHNTGTCDGGPIVCQHGGIVNPKRGLCTCPPGYTGPLCQHPLTRGQFGHSGQFDVADFFGPTSEGLGIAFSFDLPFGNSCGAGYYGVGCDRKCPIGRFGAGCLFECHCVDCFCSPTGVCTNGCGPGFMGPTCQQTV